MDQAVKHVYKYALYYTLILIIVCCLSYISYIHSRKSVEKFDDLNQVSTTNAPVQAGEDVCQQLQMQIDQYVELKEKHKETLIMNLDETIDMLKKIFTQYMCDTYVSG